LKTFVILGMHRSATSLPAQGLSKAGVRMGDRLLGVDPDSNPYGHYEDVDFIRMNEWLLNSAGGSWRNPPSELDLEKAGKENGYIIKKLVRRKEREPFWGWKDPRTTLTIRMYLPYLTNPHFIACFREPLEVARSLNKRNGIPVEEGLKLAGIYNEKLLGFLEEFSGQYEDLDYYTGA